MTIFNRMFANKILEFHEDTNRTIRILMQLPVIGHVISKKIFDQDRSKVRAAFGIVAQIARMLLDFIRKFIYVAFFIYLPYTLIARVCPLVASHQELTVIYMFTVLSTICGSLANNMLLELGDRDYLMIRVMQISPFMNFFGRLTYKMITDFIYFSIILTFFQVSIFHSICLGIVTMCARPIGEMISVIRFDEAKLKYKSKSSIKGAIMAVSILVAYFVPLLSGNVSNIWLVAAHPVMVLFMMVAGAGAMYYLWHYENYRSLMRAAMHIKRED